MTRRVMKPQPRPITKGPVDSKTVYTSGWLEGGDVPDYILKLCPYGVPGDRLWVREQHQIIVADSAMKYGEIDYDEIDYKTGKGLRVVYCATDEVEEFYNEDQERDSSATRPSIFMPRWASRTTLEITVVRVERVQDITEDDARAEGITDGGCLNCGMPEPCSCDNPMPDARDAYAYLWNSLHGDNAWLRNDFVWVIEFKRVSK